MRYQGSLSRGRFVETPTMMAATADAPTSE